MQSTTQHQKIFSLFTAFADTQQVIPSQLMNTLTVVTDFADSTALLGGDIGDAYRCVGNGLDRPDDFIQRAVSGLGLALSLIHI